MLIHAQRSFLLILLVALSACQSLGLQNPETFREQLAYSYSQNAAFRLSTAQALKAGTLTKSDGQQVLTTTDTVRSALDEAKALSAKGGGDTSTALGKLQLAQGLLQTVQAFLASRGVK
jgi:hypothetical protein